MSGVVKGVKKVFKKVAKVVKKYWKYVAVAVAAYFTAGVALSFMGATGATAAATLPGFAGGGTLGLGIGAGATAGTGVFSTFATTIGLGSGLAEGAAAISAAASAGSAPYAVAAGNIGSGGVALGNTSGAILGGQVAPAVVPAVAPTVAPTVAKAGMSLADKFLLAKTGVDVLGATLGPSEKQVAQVEAEAQARFYGAYYGTERDGTRVAPVSPVAPGGQSQSAASEPTQTSTLTSQLGPQPQESQQLFESPQPQAAPQGALFPDQESVPTPSGPDPHSMGQMQQNIQVPTSVAAAAPGVRYV